MVQKKSPCAVAHTRVARAHVRVRAYAREKRKCRGQRTTFTVTYRVVTRPVRGTITTRTLHVPTEVPRTELPTNRQRVVPDVMLIRIVPCDFRGMDSPAAAAMRAAVTVRSLFTVSVRDVPAASAVVCESPAGVVDVVEVVGAAMVGDVAGAAGVVPAVEAGAAVVVVVETVSDDTVAAAARSVWSFTPSWPAAFAPQHCTAPVTITAHAWFAPTARSRTVPASPVTAEGASTFDPVVPLPTCPEALLPQH